MLQRNHYKVIQSETKFFVTGATLEPVRLRDVYELIYSLSRTQKVSYLCSLFEVSRTAYYRYRQGKSHNADKKYNRPKHEIRKEFIQNFKRYGSRRIKESLKQKGIKIGRRKVAEIMRKEGLRAIQPPKFIPRTTDSGHGKRVSPNLLLNQPRPSKPNTVWVSDISAPRMCDDKTSCRLVFNRQLQYCPIEQGKFDWKGAAKSYHVLLVR